MVRSKRSKRYFKRTLWLSIPAVMGVLMYSFLNPHMDYPESPQFRDGTFHNAKPPVTPKLRKKPGLWLRFLFETRIEARPASPLPVMPVSAATLDNAADGTLYRLGHSTILMKLNGKWWLTDPQFSERASPVSWAGPKRFHNPPLALDTLPHLAAVIISHDHYDHLDKHTIQALAAKTDRFLTPLGVGDILIRWGVAKEKVTQLDWWQEKEIAGVRFTATPAQHFSGRTPFDRNRTLWASWAIRSLAHNLFFSGDTGYHEDFKEIGRRLGPFDITMLETGAYDKMWAGVHMHPEEVIQAFKDLRGHYLMPIHNGTFDLGFHTWDDPFKRIHALAEQQEIPLLMPVFGEAVSIDTPAKSSIWWQTEQ